MPVSTATQVDFHLLVNQLLNTKTCISLSKVLQNKPQRGLSVVLDLLHLGPRLVAHVSQLDPKLAHTLPKLSELHPPSVNTCAKTFFGQYVRSDCIVRTLKQTSKDHKRFLDCCC